MRFTTNDVIPVVPPFRLDLTTDALRRLASNAVDVVAEDGSYYRALADGASLAMVRVRQVEDCSLEVETTAKNARPLVARVRSMLGASVDLSDWYPRVESFPWLARLSELCRGIKPPRYASLWEACAHAIVFQQISIHAASSIMRRLVDALGDAIACDGVTVVAFPTSAALLRASDELLTSVGLSTNKRMHLRSAADAIESGEIESAELEKLSTSKATEKLVHIRGIGPWSAAVVMLRGFGRLDTFPMRDSGVARLMAELSGDREVDLDAILTRLGPLRGMLYYHLLLGRIRNLVTQTAD